MNDKNLIDSSCQGHLPVQCASNIDFFTRSDTDVVIDSEQHLSRMCKARLLLFSIDFRVYTRCSALPFYTPTKWLTRLHIKNKTVFTLIINNIYILDIYSKIYNYTNLIEGCQTHLRAIRFEHRTNLPEVILVL